MSERTDRIRAAVCSEWQTTRQIKAQSDYDGTNNSGIYHTLKMMEVYGLVESRRTGEFPEGDREWRLTA